MRILALALVLCGLLAPTASAARVIPASSWAGKLTIRTTWDVVDDETTEHTSTVRRASASHAMSGRAPHLLIAHRPGERHSFLGGGGFVTERPGTVTSEMTDDDGRRRLHWECRGKQSNLAGETMQFQLERERAGGLQLMLDSVHLMPKERCTPDEGWESPTTFDGWPEDLVFELPAAPQARSRLVLDANWFRHYTACNDGVETKGMGSAPPPVETYDGFVQCRSGYATQVRARLELRRVCRHVRFRVWGTSGRERCVTR